MRGYPRYGDLSDTLSRSDNGNPVGSDIRLLFHDLESWTIVSVRLHGQLSLATLVTRDLRTSRSGYPKKEVYGNSECSLGSSPRLFFHLYIFHRGDTRFSINRVEEIIDDLFCTRFVYSSKRHVTRVRDDNSWKHEKVTLGKFPREKKSLLSGNLQARFRIRG